MHPCVDVTGQNIRKLVKDGFVIRKPQTIHSRARARREAEAKAKGRHSGYGEQQQPRVAAPAAPPATAAFTAATAAMGLASASFIS